MYTNVPTAARNVRAKNRVPTMLAIPLRLNLRMEPPWGFNGPGGQADVASTFTTAWE